MFERRFRQNSSNNNMTHLRLSEDWRCQFHTMSLLPFHIQCLRNLFLQTELFCISLEPAETRSTRCTSENNSNFESSILGHILKEQTLKSMYTEKIRFLQISLPEYNHTCLVAAYTLFIYRGSVELTPNFLVYEHHQGEHKCHTYTRYNSYNS